MELFGELPLCFGSNLRISTNATGYSDSRGLLVINILLDFRTLVFEPWKENKDCGYIPEFCFILYLLQVLQESWNLYNRNYDRLIPHVIHFCKNFLNPAVCNRCKSFVTVTAVHTAGTVHSTYGLLHWIKDSETPAT
jgi:hypothetical protein